VWIVAMTAHTMQGDRDECLAAGMDTYIPKPIDPAALFAAVEQPRPVRSGITKTGDALGEFAVEGASEGQG
jgi:CheY-like chemotaxis protein